MDKFIGKIVVGALAGLGIGLFVGKREIRRLQAERNDLLKKNSDMKTTNEELERRNANLKEVNQFMKNCLTQDEES